MYSGSGERLGRNFFVEGSGKPILSSVCGRSQPDKWNSRGKILRWNAIFIFEE